MTSLVVTASAGCLGAAVVAYGCAPLLLTRSARGHSTGSLGDVNWWLGTGVQGLGFVAAFFARHALPLLIVQPVLTASLAITAALEGRRQPRRNELLLYGAVLVLFVGLAALATVARVGTSGAPTPVLTAGFVVAVLLAAGGLLPLFAPGSTTHMVLAGIEFSVVAVLARILAADPARMVTQIGSALLTLLMVGAAISGQFLQTKALRSAASLVTPAAGMWLVETIVPAAVGLLFEDDRVRAGSWPMVVLGLTVSCAAVIVLSSELAAS